MALTKLSRSLKFPAAVYRKYLTRDVTGLLGRKENDGVSDIFPSPKFPDRNLRHDLSDRGIRHLTFDAAREHPGCDPAGTQGIGTDSVTTVLPSCDLKHAFYSGLWSR